MKRLSFLLLVAFLGQLVRSWRPLRMRIPQKSSNTTHTPFDWLSITPKPYLEYHDCYSYGRFQCARLLVPMNYNATDPQTSETVALGIIRLPARVPVTDPRYGGAILTNPGGPGGSGVASVRESGRALQTLADAAYANGSTTYVSNSNSGLYFDVISWDPRAVDNTTPFYTCQRSPAQQIIQYLQGQTPILGTPEGNFDYIWSQWASLDQGCVYDPVTNPQGSKIERYASTTYAVLDMVEIIEHHGQWREKQAKTPAQKKRLKWQKGEEPLLYAGGSYGTDIGQVFASMQPHRVKRMFLDGVDDTEDTISGALLQGLWSVDAIMDHCFEYCALAGPNECGLYAGPTAEDTKKRLLGIISDLEINGPVPVPRHGKYDAMIVTLSDIWNQLYGNLVFAPIYSFKEFANAVGPLSQRDGRMFVKSFKAGALPIFTSSTGKSPSVMINQNDPASDTHRWASYNGISNAIACPEAWIRRNKTQMREFLNYCRRQSYWGGNTYATWYMACQSTFKVETEWNFLLDHPVGSNVTAHGILLASNIFDPICPLKSARLAHSNFKGSALIINDGDGHETSSNPSLEVGKLVRKYFQTGELPPPDQPVTLPLARPLLGANGPRTAPLAKNASLEDRMLASVIGDLPV